MRNRGRGELLGHARHVEDGIGANGNVMIKVHHPISLQVDDLAVLDHGDGTPRAVTGVPAGKHTVNPDRERGGGSASWANRGKQAHTAPMVLAMSAIRRMVRPSVRRTAATTGRTSRLSSTWSLCSVEITSPYGMPGRHDSTHHSGHHFHPPPQVIEARVVAPREPQYLSPVRMTVDMVVRCESLHVASVGIHDVDLQFCPDDRLVRGAIAS